MEKKQHLQCGGYLLFVFLRIFKIHFECTNTIVSRTHSKPIMKRSASYSVQFRSVKPSAANENVLFPSNPLRSGFEKRIAYFKGVRRE